MGEKANAYRAEVSDRIVAVMQENPGVRSHVYADILGMKHSVFCRHANRLAKKGIITKDNSRGKGNLLPATFEASQKRR